MSRVSCRTTPNRLLHPPTKGIGTAQLVCDCNDPAALTSHAISKEAVERLRAGDPAGFLSLRSTELLAWNADFFAVQAEWDMDDSPSLTALRSAS